MWTLAAGGCAAGTSEFMPAGLLPNIAEQFGVSIAAAGSLVSVFAGGVILGAIGAAALNTRIPRKIGVTTALGSVAAGHIVGAHAVTFETLLISRLFCAVAVGVFWTYATEFTVAISPPTLRVRALARLTSSMVVASVLGVPLGAFLGDQTNWRVVFGAVAVISVAAAVFLAFVAEPAPLPVPPKSEPVPLCALLKGKLLLAYLMICIYESSVMSLVTFIKPLLLNATGLSIGQVPWALAAFGIGGFFGLRIAGRYADRWPNSVLAIALIAAAASALALRYASGAGFATGLACLVGYGLSVFMAAPALNARTFVFTEEAPILASAGNTAAFNTGAVLGAAVGGLAVTRWGESAAPLAAALFSLLTLFLALMTSNTGSSHHVRPAGTTATPSANKNIKDPEMHFARSREAS